MTNNLLIKFGAETAEAPEGIAALGFDAKAFLIQLVTFLLVFYILKRYVFGRIIKTLEDRRETIEEGLRLTTEMVAQRDKLDQEVTETRAKARKEADEILARTSEQASIIIKEAEEAAKTKAEALMVEARKKIEEETTRARRKLEAEVADLVIEATETIIEEKLDSKKDASLLSRALKGING